MLTGAPPSLSGIIGNDWYDRALKKNVTSVEDPGTRLLGAGDAPGSSPHRLRVSTVGDELKMAHPGSRVIGLSHKDRSAILMGGRMADLALWWDTRTGAFVTSTWYRAELPGWATAFNAGRPADAWVGREWRAVGEGGSPAPCWAGCRTRRDRPTTAASTTAPSGTSSSCRWRRPRFEGERLGSRETTDVLAVSFSCNDAVGHDKGPYSAEVRDITVRTDLALDRLLAAIDRRVGLSRTLVVVTADHGVAPVPEQMKAWKMPAGRFTREDLEKAATDALEKAFGPGPWLEGRAGSALYLNRALMAERGLDAAAVEARAASGAESVASVWRAYTRSQLLEGRVPPDPWSRRVIRLVRPRALGRRGRASRALLDVRVRGDDPRHDLLVRHPHPADRDGPGNPAGSLRRDGGAQRPRAHPGDAARRRDPERGVRTSADRDPRARRLSPLGGAGGGPRETALTAARVEAKFLEAEP